MTDDEKITQWTILITGWSQDEGTPHTTGLERLYYRIKRTYTDRRHEILLKSWADDMDALADRICNHSQARPWIILVGYSYGGQSAINLCKELSLRGQSVGYLILIDAIARPWLILKWWLSLTGWLRLVIPPNVENCWAWRQCTNIPKGHSITVSRRTKMHGPYTLSVAHEFIDEQAEIHAKVLEVLGE